MLRPSDGVVTISLPFFATNRPSELLVWPSKLTGFVTMGQGGAFGSLACHFLAASLSESEVGRKPQPVRSFPLNRFTKPGSVVNWYGSPSINSRVAKIGRKAAAHLA